MKKKSIVGNLIRNIPFLVSGLAVAALRTTSLSEMKPIVIMFVVLVVASMYLDNIYTYWKSNISVFSLSVSFCLLVIFGCCFYSTMVHKSEFQTFGGAYTKVIAAISALLGVVAGLYFLSTVVSAIYSVDVFGAQERSDLQLSAGQKTIVTGKQFVFIFITAVAAVTICSKSAPIYPFNDWMDSNCFMTVGKSIRQGVVPYRDLYEQKGPLLYMLHALAAMVSETTFIGVYFLEIVAAVAFLFYSYKLMKLYQQSASILLVPVLAAVVYSAKSFFHGDSAEEFCLPLFSYAIYLAARFLRQGKCPTWLECVAVGVTSAFVLWIKFSMLGFYFGWFCVIAWQIIRHRDTKKLLRIVLWIGAGVFITTIPILIYFGMNHALADLWEVYFYNNLFLYSTESNQLFPLVLAKNLLGGMKNVLNQSPIPAAMIGIGLLALAKKRDKTDLYAYLIMLVFTFLLVYSGGRHYRYYAIIFGSFAPIGILAICKMLPYHLSAGYQRASALPIFRRFSAWMICAGSLVFAFAMCDNTYMLRYSKSDLPQYQFAEIITQKEDATLLNYGFMDGGFYTTTGIIPNCRFFCKLNISLDEMMKTQNAFVQTGQVDFVVTRDEELKSDRYECIAKTVYYLEGAAHEYFLYQLIL